MSAQVAIAVMVMRMCVCDSSGVLDWASKLGQLQSDPGRPILALVDSQPVGSDRIGEEKTAAGFGHMGRGGSPGLMDSCQELAFVASFGYT